MITVTTDHIPARERAEFWADLVSRHVTPVAIEPAGTHAVHGGIQAQAIGFLESRETMDSTRNVIKVDRL